MSETFIISFSIALTLTTFFAFRWRVWKRPLLLAGYFLLFMTVEWIAQGYLLPPGALGMEVAYVCFGITGLLLVVILIASLVSGEDGKGKDAG